MNKAELNRHIRFHDENQEGLADAMGISRSRLNAKICERHGAGFTTSEIAFIIGRYNLSKETAQKIFG